MAPPLSKPKATKECRTSSSTPLATSKPASLTWPTASSNIPASTTASWLPTTGCQVWYPRSRAQKNNNRVIGDAQHSSPPSKRWLLLGHAVHGAESPDHVARIDRDDLPRREQVCQRVQSDAVIGIVEDWHQHDAVCDVKIGVAGRKASLLEDHRTRHGKFDNVEGLAGLIARALKTAKVILQRFVIHVFGIRLDHSNDGVGSDEAGEIIDVAVSIVPRNAAPKPDDIGRA